MEKYNAERSFNIVDISRSDKEVTLLIDPLPDNIKITLTPYLVLCDENKLATAIISAQFFTKDEVPMTNELEVRLEFKFNNSLPIIMNEEEIVEVNNYDDLLLIFDTALGAFRGILFEWLKGTGLQRPLPFINIENFVEKVKISFINSYARG